MGLKHAPQTFVSSQKKKVCLFFLICSFYGPHMSSGVIDQDRKFIWHRRRSHSWTTSNIDRALPAFEWRFTAHSAMRPVSQYHLHTKKWICNWPYCHASGLSRVRRQIWMPALRILNVHKCDKHPHNQTDVWRFLQSLHPLLWWALNTKRVESEGSFQIDHSKSSFDSTICSQHMHSQNILA